MPAALIAVASLGLPLLFALYLRESGVSPRYPTQHAGADGGTRASVLGVGWVLLTGAAMARAYGVPLGAGIAGGRILRDGIGVPVGSMLLMLVPALVARFAWRGNREALDGYAIGALGALTFTAAATLTRLAPQFTTGMINRVRPTGRTARRGRNPRNRHAADRRRRRRPDRHRAVVHPTADQSRQEPRLRRGELSS